MNRFTNLLFVVAIALCANTDAFSQQVRFRVGTTTTSAAPTAQLAGSTLAATDYVRWVNGDLLPGSLLSATDSHMKWQGKEFVGPFDVDVTQLDYVRFASPDRTKHGEPIRVVLQGGDVLYGDLVGITDTHLEFTSKRHGTAKLKRSDVISLRRLANGSLIYLGPGGRNGWRTGTPKFNITHWNPVDGHLTTRIPGAQIYRALAFEEKVEIEVHLKWIRKPGFFIALMGGPLGDVIPKGVVGLETWDNTLVIHSEDDFEEVTEITSKMKSLQLRLFIDYTKGEFSVFSREGKQLATLKTGTTTRPKAPGFFIRNKSSDLTLMRVRASRWGGQPPREVRDGVSRVHLVDGNVEYGKIKSYSKSAGMVIVDENGKESTIQYAQFDSMYLPVEAKPPTTVPQVQVTFVDGAAVSGKLAGVDAEGRVGVSTSYSEAPIWSDLKAARSINFTFPKTTETKLPPDVLSMTSAKLHGSLTASNDPKNPLAWLPVGSRTSSAIRPDVNGQVIREQPEAGESPIDQGFKDILYLTNQDVVPCQIKAVDDEHLRISTPLVEIRQVPNTSVKAVELALSAPLENEGFGDGGWKMESFAGEGGVTHNDKEVAFNKPGRITHNTIMYGDEATFDINWNVATSCMISATPFAKDARRNPRQSTSVNIQINQQTIWVSGGNGHFFGNVRPVNCPKGKATVTLKAEGKQMRVIVNGQLCHSAQFPGGKVPGNGISMTFNPTDGSNGRPRMMVMNNFQVRQSSGGRATPRISAEKKNLILTVPRMRRDNPPSHVLVARNGDMLRGRLVGLNDENVVFTSRLDDFQFKRDRLACIIWLHADHLKKKKDQKDVSADDKPIEPPANVNQPGIPQPAIGGLPAQQIDNFVVRNLVRVDIADGTSNTVAIGETIAPRQEKLEEDGKSLVRVELSHGTRITFHPTQIKDGQLLGESKVLGACSVPLKAIRRLHFGTATKALTAAYSDWVLSAAREPKLASSSGRGGGSGGRSFGTNSPLVGKLVQKISATQIDGKVFKLDQHKGKVVILDFWATWCAPCVSSLPKVMAAVDKMDPKKVVFVAVNQGENREVVSRFIGQREWKLNVALDVEMKIGDTLGANALPHTVIIGPDGKVAVVHTGTHPKIGEELKKAVEGVLGDSVDKPAHSEADAPKPADLPPENDAPVQATKPVNTGAADPLPVNLDPKKASEVANPRAANVPADGNAPAEKESSETPEAKQ